MHAPGQVMPKARLFGVTSRDLKSHLKTRSYWKRRPRSEPEPERIPKPCVAGSNPAEGTNVCVLLRLVLDSRASADS